MGTPVQAEGRGRDAFCSERREGSKGGRRDGGRRGQRREGGRPARKETTAAKTWRVGWGCREGWSCEEAGAEVRRRLGLLMVLQESEWWRPLELPTGSASDVSRRLPLSSGEIWVVLKQRQRPARWLDTGSRERLWGPSPGK